MATGRIGVTPTLGTRWSKAPAGGTTALSGLDDSSVSLVYSVGYEQVYRNGVLLSRGNDYTATTGNSITLIDATIAGDIIEVFANELVPLTDAISKGQFTAKGTLLSASAASTPAVLGVGSNDQVLTADSTTTTGLKWATPSAGGMTLINTGGTTLTGSSVSISSIPNTYKELKIIIRNFLPSTNAGLKIRVNNDSTANRHYTYPLSNELSNVAFDGTEWFITSNANSSTSQSLISVNIPDYANTSTWKIGFGLGTVNSSTTSTNISNNTYQYWYNQTSAISELVFRVSAGNFTSGTVYVYGVN